MFQGSLQGSRQRGIRNSLGWAESSGIMSTELRGLRKVVGLWLWMQGLRLDVAVVDTKGLA